MLVVSPLKIKFIELTSKLIIVTFFVLYNSFFYSQNLVENPSFEDYSSCPDTPGQIGNASNWYISSGTADYFNSCSPTNTFNTPSNEFGYIQPVSGTAYAGFATWSSANPVSPNKEIIRGTLTAPLVQGQTYYASFYISAGAAYSSGPDHECYSNNICFQCDKNAYPIAQNSSTLIIDSIITDTSSWLHVTHSFVADTSYTYFFIGNWENDSTLQYLQSPSATSCSPYYFLDNVCISTEPSVCDNAMVINTYLSELQFELFPNPSSGRFKVIGIDIQYIQVTNVLGKIIFEQKIKNGEEVEVNIPGYWKGVHFVKVMQKGRQSTKKIILK